MQYENYENTEIELKCCKICLLNLPMNAYRIKRNMCIKCVIIRDETQHKKGMRIFYLLNRERILNSRKLQYIIKKEGNDNLIEKSNIKNLGRPKKIKCQ